MMQIRTPRWLIKVAALVTVSGALVAGPPDAKADHCSPTNSSTVLTQAYGTDFPAQIAPSAHPFPGCTADPFAPNNTVKEAADLRLLYAGVSWVQPSYLQNVGGASTLTATVTGPGLNKTVTLTKKTDAFGTGFVTDQWVRLPAIVTAADNFRATVTVRNGTSVVGTSTYHSAGS